MMWWIVLVIVVVLLIGLMMRQRKRQGAKRGPVDQRNVDRVRRDSQSRGFGSM
jgi:hypothetical protein